MIDDLHSRQTRLPDIGKRGQELLAAARVTLASDRASSVAAEYLRRSGVGCVQERPDAVPSEFVHAQHFSQEVSRDFAHGAWIATHEMVRLLGIDPRHGR